MAAADQRRLHHLLGSPFLKFSFKRNAEVTRGEYVRSIGAERDIVDALHRLMDICEGKAPLHENFIPKDRSLGDVQYCLQRYDLAGDDIKAAIKGFVLSLLKSHTFKQLKHSGSTISYNLRKRFYLDGEERIRRERKKDGYSNG